MYCGPTPGVGGPHHCDSHQIQSSLPLSNQTADEQIFLHLIWTKLIMRYPCPVTPALLSNPSPKLWSHIRHQSLPPPLDPHLMLTSLSDGNNASSPCMKLSHHILSRQSMTVRKVMTSRMHSAHYVQMPGTWVTCAGYVLTPTWVGNFMTRCHSQMPEYHP